MVKLMLVSQTVIYAKEFGVRQRVINTSTRRWCVWLFNVCVIPIPHDINVFL